MSKSSNVIEYFGLPGCGKTTLCNNQKIEHQNVAITTDLSKEMKRVGIIRVLVSFPWYIIIPLVKLFFSVPFAGLGHINRYKNFFIKETMYNFARKYSQYQYIYIDHGLAQSFIQLIYEYPDCFGKKVQCNIINVLRKSAVDKVIYCQVEPEVSLVRIRKRNRQTPGRLDAKKNDKELLDALITQNIRYRTLASLLEDHIKEKYTTIFT